MAGIKPKQALETTVYMYICFKELNIKHIISLPDFQPMDSYSTLYLFNQHLNLIKITFEHCIFLRSNTEI